MATGTTPACAGSTIGVKCGTKTARDHPRLRGEHQRPPRGVVEGGGPPPPARGALPRRQHRSLEAGTTPACAGSTASRASPRAAARDHPACAGSTSCGLKVEHTRQGPPPPARGAPSPSSGRTDVAGTTPACAGSTLFSIAHASVTRDHPRLRGEHYERHVMTDQLAGPPPPARGAPVAQHRRSAHGGTTPACAGSTAAASRRGRRRRDHPRLRGEHRLVFADESGHPGPPPPARGARRSGGCRVRAVGTTPACAGSTATTPASGWPARDHPRLRGEHASGSGPSRWPRGPPPPARGARRDGPLVQPAERTTPACAGSTQTARGSRPRRGDHPRLRGEHRWTSTSFKVGRGPPPPARGAQPRRVRHLRRPGTTPACAGSTAASAAPETGSWDHPRLRGEHALERVVRQVRLGPPPPARGAPCYRR